jgi:2-hydroxychromene-2-carboxylate isomerase
VDVLGYPSGSRQAVFYYDLGDPGCYLGAERILSELPVVPEWEPVLGTELGTIRAQLGAIRAELGVTRAEQDLIREAGDRARLEALAVEIGLQPIRWPAQWPPDSREAMLAATYAKRIGRVVAFSLAAFRQAFAGGRDLGDRDTILIAGAACEMHPSALLKAIELRSVAEALEQAGARARRAGVAALPAIQVGDEVFEGLDLLEAAGSALAS